MFRSGHSKQLTIVRVLSLCAIIAALALSSCGGGGGSNQPACPPCASQETSFWAANFTTNSYYCICAAEVSTGGAHSRIFVEHGRALPLLLSGLQTEFDTNIYPADTSNFGSEPNPGIDNDPLITILLLNIRDGLSGASSSYVAGYFDRGNEYPLSANPFSNQREMLYLNINPILINSGHVTATDFYTILAHEFQHMIHWEQKSHQLGRDDDTWLDEAMSEAAPTYIYGPSCERLDDYEQDPSNSLTDWQGTVADYGIAYMWSQYFKEQFDQPQPGGSIFKKIMQQNFTGVTAVDNALASIPSSRRFDTTFYDMSIAIASGVTTSTWWPGHPEWTFTSIETWPSTCGAYTIPGIFNNPKFRNITTLPLLGPSSITFSSYTPTTISATTGTVTWNTTSGSLAAFIDYGNNKLTTGLVSGVSYSYTTAGLLVVSNPSYTAVASGGSVVRSSVSTLAPAISLSPKLMLESANASSQALGRPRSVCVQSAFKDREKEMRRKGFKPGF